MPAAVSSTSYGGDPHVATMQGTQWKTDRRSLCRIGCEILTCPREQRTIQELQELPEAERRVVWADMSGNAKMAPHVEELREEQPDFVRSCRKQLDDEIAKISTKQAYDDAREMDPDFVEGEDMQMMFLRAELYDPMLAAKRIVSYFEEKLTYFGRDKLVKKISFDDLDEDDTAALMSGNLQMLPSCDHAGRRVMFFYKAFIEGYKRRENMLRTTWFLTHLAIEDAKSQKLGVVVVVYNLGGFPKHGNDWEKSRRLSQMLRALPMRIDSFLVCFDDAIWNTVVEGFSFMISRFLRVRLRPISGSRQECYYKLMALGVPYFALPVTPSNQMVRDNHVKMLTELRRRMSETPDKQRQEISSEVVEEQAAE